MYKQYNPDSMKIHTGDITQSSSISGSPCCCGCCPSCIGVCATGPTGATGPAATIEKIIMLATPNEIPTGSYLGIGSSSTNFSNSSFVIPEDTTITNIVLHIRNKTLAENDTVTATVYTSPNGDNPTATTAIVTTTAPQAWNSTAANVVVSAGTLVSVQISSDTTLQNGAAVTLTTSD